MIFYQFLRVPVEQQHTVVGNTHLVVENLYLDGSTRHPVVVNQCIEDALPHCISRERILFDSSFLVVRNSCLKILEIYEVEDFVCYLEERAIDFVLIEDVCFASELSDLDICPSAEFLRIFMEQQHGCLSQFPVFRYKVKRLKQFRIRHFKVLFRHSSRTECLSSENLETVVVQFIDRHIIHRRRVPMHSGLGNNERCQRIAFQLLFRAAAAIVKLAVIADWKGTWADGNLYVFFFVLSQQVHVTDNPHAVLYFVRNVLHKPRSILHSDNLLGIIDTDVYASALCIGETAYPPEILVSPALLKLYILRLFHPRHNSKFLTR